MFIDEPLPFVKEFINQLNDGISQGQSGPRLSIRQKAWLGFCLMGILITNSVCWAKFERASLGNYSRAALSWMFKHSKIPWSSLFTASVNLILTKYGLTEGTLIVDDSDNKRSKSAKRIYKVHKIYDKSSGGYINGQEIVILLLVTAKVTIPVGFRFYMPDPVQSEWKKQDKKLKEKGISKKYRPAAHPKSDKYPTKLEIALTLLEDFKHSHPSFKVKAILADALYGTADFLDKASAKFGGIQVISQIRFNQNIRYRGNKKSVLTFFEHYTTISQNLLIRGGVQRKIQVGSARLYVHSHQKKRFVIALKYEDENEYRYLIASNLSWRTQDIVQAYTYRWLVEVFFEDWKSYEGWGQLAKQPDYEGSSRSLILSLLLDHCLLLHPEQLSRQKFFLKKTFASKVKL
ncbi:MAG TPA: transposase [Arcobacter sp.]|nr:transposase [Arcobacter sp.]